jgi:large subunit ribosomal protein L15
MQLQNLKSPKGSRKRKKIVGRGRGSGFGKTSGRGENGQKARNTGRTMVGSSEGGQMPLIRRLPKVGFRSKRPILNQIVPLGRLNQFESGTVIDGAFLKAQGLIKSLNKPFKILGDGELKKSLTVQVKSVSKTAEVKIKKAGGKIEAVKEKAKPQEAPSKES